eukprot:PhF_6_TR20703/c0_g1_i1/m.29778
MEQPTYRPAFIGPSGTASSMMHHFRGDLVNVETELATYIHQASHMGTWESTDGSTHGTLLVALRDISDNVKRFSDALSQRMASLWLGQQAQYSEYARLVEDSLIRKHKKDLLQRYPQQQSHLFSKRKLKGMNLDEVPVSQKRRSEIAEMYGYVFDNSDPTMGLFLDSLAAQSAELQEYISNQNSRLQEGRHIDEQRLQTSLRKIVNQVNLLGEIIEQNTRRSMWDHTNQQFPVGRKGPNADVEPV